VGYSSKRAGLKGLILRTAHPQFIGVYGLLRVVNERKIANALIYIEMRKLIIFITGGQG
jgi:hypothetical protein